MYGITGRIPWVIHFFARNFWHNGDKISSSSFSKQELSRGAHIEWQLAAWFGFSIATNRKGQDASEREKGLSHPEAAL